MSSASPPRVTPDAIRALMRARLTVEVPDRGTDLFGAGLLDSLGLIDLFLALEETFGIVVVVDEVDFEDFRTLDTITAYVERRLG